MRRDAMAAFGPWADLNSELLVSIGVAAAAACSSLRDYTRLRSVCTAWRSALATPFPCLLVLSESHRASVFSLTMQRSFHLHTSSALDVSDCLTGPSTLHRPIGFTDPSTIFTRNRVTGTSNDGCFAVARDRPGSYSFSSGTVGIVLLNPRTGEEIALLPPIRDDGCLRKIVFAPNPRRRGDCAAVAICDITKVAYTNTRDMDWTIIDVAIAFTEKLADLAYDTEGGKVYCLDSRGEVHVLRIPRGGGREQKPVLEPLQTEHAGLRFDPAAVFAAPYDIASKLTFTKHIFLCDGSLYQVWQNISSTVTSPSPANGGGFKMLEDEIFVMRYYPGRRSPCWDAVKDLGGCSVFIGKNSPVVVRAAAVLAVRPNCVYWIDWLGVPMVCDIATGASTPCLLPYGVCRGSCWYFRIDSDGREQFMSYDEEQGTAKRFKT